MTKQRDDDVDVEVVGGGPAGASVAIRLAHFGFRARLYDVPFGRRQHVAESLPSSLRVVLKTLGVRLPEDVHVERPPGHHVYWGEMAGAGAFPREAPKGEGSFLVWRGAFDACLRNAAIAAGVQWCDGRAPRERGADFLVDASGRAGFLAREWREPEQDFHTLALTGHFRVAGGPTLIETFHRGFVWSAPLRNGLRDVTVFADAGERLADYEELLSSAPHAAALVAGAELEGPVRAADATPYQSSCYGSSEHLLVGDAASFLDPLSSHGVHKAMDGALVAAAVIRTLLERPSAIDDAIHFYDERESSLVRATAAKMSRLYQSERRFASRPFWKARSSLSRETETVRPPSPLPPLDRSMKLGPGEGVRIEKAPVLENDYIETREVLVAPGKERPVRYLGDQCLPDLYRDVVAKGLGSLLSHTNSSHVFNAVDWLYRSGYLIRLARTGD